MLRREKAAKGTSQMKGSRNFSAVLGCEGGSRTWGQGILASGIIVLASSQIALAGPTVERPGLIRPLPPSPRVPVSVPDSGPSIILIGIAIVGLGIMRWIGRIGQKA